MRPTTRLLLCKEVNELSTFETTNQVGTQFGRQKNMFQKMQPRKLGNIYHTWKHIPHWCFIQNNERILTIRQKKLPTPQVTKQRKTTHFAVSHHESQEKTRVAFGGARRL
jgi:hypothetical protein